MTQRTVTKIASPKVQTEGGGFLIRKVIGGVIPTCDPFLMLDHIGMYLLHTYSPLNVGRDRSSERA